MEKCLLSNYENNMIDFWVGYTPGREIANRKCRQSLSQFGVVTHDVPPGSVVAGNPAKVIKSFDSLECKPKLFNKPFEWWGQDAE